MNILWYPKYNLTWTMGISYVRGCMDRWSGTGGRPDRRSCVPASAWQALSMQPQIRSLVLEFETAGHKWQSHPSIDLITLHPRAADRQPLLAAAIAPSVSRSTRISTCISSHRVEAVLGRVV